MLNSAAEAVEKFLGVWYPELHSDSFYRSLAELNTSPGLSAYFARTERWDKESEGCFRNVCYNSVRLRIMASRTTSFQYSFSFFFPRSSARASMYLKLFSAMISVRAQDSAEFLLLPRRIFLPTGERGNRECTSSPWIRWLLGASCRPSKRWDRAASFWISRCIHHIVSYVETGFSCFPFQHEVSVISRPRLAMLPVEQR